MVSFILMIQFLSTYLIGSVFSCLPTLQLVNPLLPFSLNPKVSVRADHVSLTFDHGDTRSSMSLCFDAWDPEMIPRCVYGILGARELVPSMAPHLVTEIFYCF